MKILLIFLSLFFSTTLLADEVINLKADMVIFKCEKSCLTPLQEGKPIQIILRAPSEGSTKLLGNYEIEKSIDDIHFSGTLQILKFNANDQTKYFIQSFLYSRKGNDYSNKSLGNSVVPNTINNLNNITWKETIKSDDVTYIVSFIVGSDQAN